jgi:hypothetical protein
MYRVGRTKVKRVCKRGQRFLSNTRSDGVGHANINQKERTGSGKQTKMLTQERGS